MIGMILCGGYGKRLKPYTDTIPAPLIEIKDNYTILDKQLFDFAAAGIDEVVLLTGYKSEMIKARYGKEFKGVRISYHEEDRPMGTLNAIKAGLEMVGGETDILVRNGDVVADVNLKKMVLRHVNSPYPATVFVTRMRSPYGIVELGDDKIKSFREKPFIDYHINGGIYCLSKNLPFQQFDGGNLEQTMFPMLAENGGLGYYKEDGVFWATVDTVRELDEVRKEYGNKTDKPWGYEKVLISTDKYLTKELFIRSGYQTSFHKHPRKDETMYIMKGVGYIEFEDHKEFFQMGDTIRIEPNVPHTIVATENTVLHEVSTPFLEDTVRIKDYYSVR
ncbi:glucose-1-phosphate adenylyltransferase [Methanocella sp. CWC-04]|uniref:Glucose-1-phosphate adenylyltransferase n=1 Tax=Methanooceanicella nereidis TaxID=2052831 RepID=A0AAP2RHD5_9EURY|nr:sugar phosphate nucleotidyltransferase [Methanocella sp. CWC-04]MCD1296252.1 glucose-1-phosphate adenylyltransferase [Methanocella sp. CWC-04]